MLVPLWRCCMLGLPADGPAVVSFPSTCDGIAAPLFEPKNRRLGGAGVFLGRFWKAVEDVPSDEEFPARAELGSIPSGVVEKGRALSSESSLELYGTKGPFLPEAEAEVEAFAEPVFGQLSGLVLLARGETGLSGFNLVLSFVLAERCSPLEKCVFSPLVAEYGVL